MTDLPLDEIIELLATYKYLLLFPISVVEGPVVSVVAGFLCAGGIFSIPTAYFVLVMGDMVGDTLYYSIGRWGGRPFIRKWGHVFGLSEPRVLKLENHFQNHAGKTLLIGKTQALGGLFLAAAGLSRMSYPKFMWFNLIGTLIKSMALLLLGYFAGQAYGLIDKYLGYYAIIASAVLITGIIIYMLIKRQPQKQQ